MSRHARRHSFDYSMPHYMQENYSDLTNTTSRRVHFDDELINYTNKDNCRIRGNNENRFQNSQLTVHEITAKLKHSYETISHGLQVLGKVYVDLRKTQDNIGGHNTQCERSTVQEINRLIKEIETLQNALQKSGNRKRKYLEELSRLQTTLHDDRTKMETWTRSTRDSNRKLMSKVDESAKKTRDQQILIQKLKNDNTSLWKILQEIQEHLREERVNSLDMFCTDTVSDAFPVVAKNETESPKVLPQIPKPTSERYDFMCDLYQVNGTTSRENSHNDRRNSDGGSSTTSSQDQYLCDKLQQLLEQSDNVQKLISNVGTTKYTGRTSCELNQSSDLQKRWTDNSANRIPSENENGVRCDVNDIIRRCEELEKKVDDCSTKDIRERIMLQLHEMDTSDNSTENSSDKYTCSRKDCELPNLSTKPIWGTDQHTQVREELLKCLDKIMELEKNFMDAQREIQRLRQYIKESGEEKEFVEQSFKREAFDLRIVVEDQRKELLSLKTDLTNASKELKQTDEVRSRLDIKSAELETLRIEMNSTIRAMSNIRLHKQVDGSYIDDELSMLQLAIYEIEQQMQIVQDQNIAYTSDAATQHTLIRQLEIDNTQLIQQLKLQENENAFLQKKIAMKEKKVDMSSNFEKDEQIKQLQLDLADAVLEMENASEQISQHINNEFGNKREDEQEDLIATLLNDSNRYLELIHHKDSTIDALRNDVNKLANIVDTKLNKGEEVEREIDDNSSNYHSGKSDISQELNTIKQMLDASHLDIADKIIELHKELRKLKDENQLLRRNMQNENPESASKTEELFMLNEELRNENKQLRDILNRPYPGIVESVLKHAKEIKDLKDENEFLRLALNNDKKDLVESNLRKRARIKELENNIGTIPNGNDQSFQKRSGSMDCSPDRSGQTSDHQHGRNRMDTDTKDDDLVGGDKKVIGAMVKQNELISTLQADNERIRSRLSSAKEDIANLTKENRIIMKEKDKLKRGNGNLKNNEKVNEALENELLSLRTALRQINQDDDLNASQNKVRELEGEIERIKHQEDQMDGDGVSPPTSPCRKKLYLTGLSRDDTRNVKKLLSENLTLKQELEKAQQDIRRLAKIADKNQRSPSPDQLQQTRMKKMEEKLKRQEDEAILLRDNMKDMESTNTNAESEINYLKATVENANSAKQKQTDEIAKLRSFIKDLHERNKEDSVVNEMMVGLNDTVEDLQQQLTTFQEKNAKVEAEKYRLENEVKTLKMNNKTKTDKKNEQLQQEKENIGEELSATHLEMNELRSANKELEDICQRLTEEIEKVRNDISETHFADWLAKDGERRLALLSPSSQRSDLTFATDGEEKSTRKDHIRVIRKLQIENQILRAKFSSLEDEAVATTKIISDMERGHGHLTGTLRCHLILQKNTTGKLLEGSLHQYHSDYETLKRKMRSLDEKYTKEKQYSKRQELAWDLFTNASATITNIQTILNEGLVKVEDDLEKDLNDFDFEDKDYKSRLWILRRRLSDVENRHRELQLRAEELNLRLDAKTTEFEVTQDELEDTTRDLESRDMNLHKLKNDLRKLSNENSKLQELIMKLKDNQDKTVGAVVLENEVLQRTTDNQDNQMKTMVTDVDEMLAKLDEKNSALNVMKKMRENAENELETLKNRINFLEKKLKDMTTQRDKLKKEADNRAGYMANLHDDHGTIHMLRDDIKRISKENTDLKQDIVLKQRQMYDMSKNLHTLKMKQDLDTSFNKQDGRPRSRNNKEEINAKTIDEIAELKAHKFLLETRLKDYERRKIGETNNNADDFFEKNFKSKLIEKEREIEKMKREKTFTKAGKSPNTSRDDTMSDINLSVFDSARNESKVPRELRKENIKLKTENELLQDMINQKKLVDRVDLEKQKRKLEGAVDKQKAEIESLTRDVDEKRKKIKELLKTIEELQEGKFGKVNKERVTKLVDKTKDLTQNLSSKEKELFKWKQKAKEHEKEIQRLKSMSAPSTGDDKFENVYLNAVTPTGSVLALTPHDGFLDRNTPQYNDSQAKQAAERSPMTTPRSYAQQVPSHGEQHMYENTSEQAVAQHTYENVENNQESSRKVLTEDLINLEPMYEELQYEPMMPASLIPRSNLTKTTVTEKEKKTSSSTKSSSKIPVTPTKKMRTQSVPTTGRYEVPVEESLGKDNKTNKKVNKLKFDIKQLTDEINIYRTKLGVNEHETLTILGADALNSVIDYQIHTRISDELNTLQHDTDELRQANETLRYKLTHLQNITFNLDSEGTAKHKSGEFEMKEKLNMTKDENNTLRELLETQTQNVKSQEAVIRTLKTDITDHRSRRHINTESEIGENKIEIKNLKKQIKENAKTLQKEKNKWKHDVKILKAKLKGEEILTKTISEQLETIKKLNVTMDQLRNEYDNKIGEKEMVGKTQQEKIFLCEELERKNEDLLSVIQKSDEEVGLLKSKLTAKDEEYEIVLQHAETALEEAKRKITEQNNENETLENYIKDQNDVIDDLKNSVEKQLKKSKKMEDSGEQFALLQKNKRNEVDVLKIEKEKILNSLNESKELYSNAKVELKEYKITVVENNIVFQKEIDELKKQCDDYETCVKHSESSSLELVSVINEVNVLKEDLSCSIKSYADLTEQNSKLRTQNESLVQEISSQKITAVDISYERSTAVESIKSDSIEDEKEEYEDLEIEYEILKGCNEELESEVESLKTKVTYFEDVLEGEESELKQTKKDLEKTLSYLREISMKNETLIKNAEEMEEQLKERNSQNVNLRITIDSLENTADRHQVTDQLTEKLKKSELKSESEQDMMKQMDEVIDQLETEIEQRGHIINQSKTEFKEKEKLVYQLESKVKERDELIVRFESQIKQREDEIGQRDSEIKERDDFIDQLESEIKQKNDLSTNEKEDKNVHDLQNIVKKLELENQQKENECSKFLKEKKDLENSLNEWIERSTAQSEQLSKIQNNILKTQEQVAEIVVQGVMIETKQLLYNDRVPYLTKQIDNIGADLEKKKELVMTLQFENQNLDDNYKTLLEDYNKLHDAQDEIENSLAYVERSKALEIGILQEEIVKKSETNKSLENSLNEWIRKSAIQSEQLSKMENDFVKTQEQVAEIVVQGVMSETKRIVHNNYGEPDLLKQVQQLKADIKKKNQLLKTLQFEIQDKENQHGKVLIALNRRRDESKSFIAMQDKMQNELDNKEDLIRKLKFKLKSNELDITDQSVDHSDDSINDMVMTDATFEDEVIGYQNQSQLILDQKESLNIMAEQIITKRKRNRKLSFDLENYRKIYSNLDKEKQRLENQNITLEKELKFAKEKLKESRTIVHESPNSSFGENENKTIGLKTKLYSSYKELREKSIEIATLQMSLEVKDLEIESLEKELNHRDNPLIVEHKTDFEHATKCTHSMEIKTLVQEIAEKDENEQDLQIQITELRTLVVDKSKVCDYLQNELKNVVGKFKEIEKRLFQEDQLLKERFLSEGNNSDISEITPLTANSFSTIPEQESVTPKMIVTDERGNETFLLDGFDDDDDDDDISYEVNIGHMNELEDSNLQKNEEIMYVKEQVNDLQEQLRHMEKMNRSLNEEKKNNEIKLTKLSRDLLKMEELEKENDRKISKKNPAEITDRNEDEAKEIEMELSRYKSENLNLTNQLMMQRKRHEIELEHLKSTLLQLKEEHVFSLKTDLEENCKSKLTNQTKVQTMEEELLANQIRLQTMEEQLNQNKIKIKELLEENAHLKNEEK